MVTLYGIPNCDQVRAARQWLTRQAVTYRFHDTRADGLDRAQLAQWFATLGQERLLNRRSATWRGLPPAARDNLNDAAAIELALAHPTLLKRPLLEVDGHLQVGFDAEHWASTLGL